MILLSGIDCIKTDRNICAVRVLWVLISNTKHCIGPSNAFCKHHRKNSQVVVDLAPKTVGGRGSGSNQALHHTLRRQPLALRLRAWFLMIV